MTRNSFVTLYWTFSHILGCFLFFWGCFPMNSPNLGTSTFDDFPRQAGNVSIDLDLAVNRHFSKVVLLMIDALRYDFVYGEQAMQFMPYTRSLIETDQSCFLKARVDPPTVTMPRIKAVITGGVPSFFDMISNLGSKELLEENWISISKQLGLNIIFYGDDTWLKLLPKTFTRMEGTTSFFISDYTKVDDNVTRNLDIELTKNDWDIMILHYLGVDHIGHLEGPSSPLIKPKLLEMDGIVKKIHQHLQQLDNATLPGLLILCGDHGMKDSGGHGGNSYSEVIVPILAVNYRCDEDLRLTEVRQNDIAAFLSVLLGQPIPNVSLGRLDRKLLSGINKYAAAYAMYYNAKRMMMLHLPSPSITDSFEKGVLSYESWLYDDGPNKNDLFINATNYFYSVQDELSLKIRQNRLNYDIISMGAGVVLVFQALWHSLAIPSRTRLMLRNYIMCLMVVSLLRLCCFLTECGSFLCDVSFLNVMFSSFVIFLMCANMIFLHQSKFHWKITSMNEFCIIVTQALHTVSLTSSSFIEEEHQFWYFNITTLLLYFMFYKKYTRALILLAVQVFLRKFNKTGDQWIHLPDLNDWLNLPENRILLSVLHISALFAVFFCDQKIISNKTNHRWRIIKCVVTFGQIVSIYLFNVATGVCYLPFSYSEASLGIFEAKLFWLFTTIKLIASVVFSKTLKSSAGEGAVGLKLDIVISLYLFVLSFLVKPHNLLMVPSLILFSEILSEMAANNFELAILHHWIGMTFYFYMGNSNSMNIDISVTFKGLQEYNIIISGLYLVLHSYGSLILSYFLLLRKCLLVNPLPEFHSNAIKALLAVYGISVLCFMIMILIVKHHLFIWSVFFPKLIKLLAQSLLLAILVLFSKLFCY